MAEEPDGIDEVIESALRVALTAAGRVAERIAREREQALRNADAGSAQQARELQARLDSERAAARAALAPVARDEWWQHAQPNDIARAWETATAWRAVDPDAQRAADRIRDQVRERYGLDVDDLRADPEAVRRHLEDRQADGRDAHGQRAAARLEEAEAARLLVDADEAERDDDRGYAGASEEAAERSYDSADRRRELAASLDGRAPSDAIQARVVADANQARPAVDAVAKAPGRAPAARRGRGKAGVVRDLPARSERAR